MILCVKARQRWEQASKLYHTIYVRCWRTGSSADSSSCSSSSSSSSSRLPLLRYRNCNYACIDLWYWSDSWAWPCSARFDRVGCCWVRSPQSNGDVMPCHHAISYHIVCHFENRSSGLGGTFGPRWQALISTAAGRLECTICSFTAVVCTSSQI